MHLGHRELVKTTIEAARGDDLISTVLTFDPLPMAVLRPEAAPRLLSGVGRRAALVAEQGPDELLVARFDATLASLAPDRFADEVLRAGIGAAHVVCGVDYRFGHRAEGDVDRLRALGVEFGFDVTAVPLLRVEGERVSSSWIRELFSKGEVKRAARLLGRDPWLDGVVIRGDGRGRGLGIPTANLRPRPGSVVPAIGVYAGYAHVAGGPARHPAAISVGRNPTFGDDRAVSVEAYLMEFDGDLYGRPLALEFHAYLRHELRFESVEELVGQMWADIAEARDLLELRCLAPAAKQGCLAPPVRFGTSSRRY